MKIVVLYLGKRGAGPMYSYEFTKALLNKNVSILAIISDYCENIKLWKKLASQCPSLTLITVKTYKSISEFIWASCNVFKYLNILQSINKFAPDYIFTPMIHPWHNIIIPFVSSKIRTIKVVHDVKVHIGERNIFSNFLTWIDIRLSDIIVVLSDFSKNQLRTKIGNKKEIVVIPHAEFGIYKDICNTSFTYSSLNNKIGFLGRINKYKGLEVLLNAFEKILVEKNNLKLLIAGNGDCSIYNNYFDRMKDSLELELRWIDDSEISSFISSVDIVVLPYIEASQSGVIPLAFSYGKPVIVTNVGGIPEQVPQNTGIIIPPKDPHILAKTILKLYNNPNDIIKMGINAQKYATENLTWESSADKLLKYIKK